MSAGTQVVPLPLTEEKGKTIFDFDGVVEAPTVPDVQVDTTFTSLPTVTPATIVAAEPVKDKEVR